MKRVYARLLAGGAAALLTCTASASAQIRIVLHDIGGASGSPRKIVRTCTGFIGMTKPHSCGGVNEVVTAADQAVLDAIGWNLNLNVLGRPGNHMSTAQIYQAYQASQPHAALVPVPEPAAWAMLVAGMGWIGATSRYRRRRRDSRLTLDRGAGTTGRGPAAFSRRCRAARS